MPDSFYTDKQKLVNQATEDIAKNPDMWNDFAPSANHIGTFSTGDFVGIEKTGMESLKDDLKQLVINVTGILDEMKSGVSKDNAFKGEFLQDAVTKFITAVQEEGKQWASQMERYCVKVDNVLSGMKTAESQLSSGLDQSTKSVSNQTTGYSYGGGSSSAS